MDICSLGFTHRESKQTGRMAYSMRIDISMVFAPLGRLNVNAIGTLELMWLIGDLKPDFKTIADLCKDNKLPIKAAFQKFIIICCELGLIGKEIVAVDGSKFRASNSRFKYHSEKKSRRRSSIMQKRPICT